MDLTLLRSRVMHNLSYNEQSKLKMAEGECNWRDNEICALLVIWSEDTIIRGNCRNVVEVRMI